jgi:hypothetical protein
MKYYVAYEVNILSSCAGGHMIKSLLGRVLLFLEL